MIAVLRTYIIPKLLTTFQLLHVCHFGRTDTRLRHPTCARLNLRKHSGRSFWVKTYHGFPEVRLTHTVTFQFAFNCFTVFVFSEPRSQILEMLGSSAVKCILLVSRLGLVRDDFDITFPLCVFQLSVLHKLKVLAVRNRVGINFIILDLNRSWAIAFCVLTLWLELIDICLKVLMISCWF